MQGGQRMTRFTCPGPLSSVGWNEGLAPLTILAGWPYMGAATCPRQVGVPEYSSAS